MTSAVPPFGYRRRVEKGADGTTIRITVEKANPEAIAHVVDTYRAEGSYAAAARRLNAEGARTDRGAGWHPSTVRLAVRREQPELVQGVRKGRAGRGRPRVLAGILGATVAAP